MDEEARYICRQVFLVPRDPAPLPGTNIYPDYPDQPKSPRKEKTSPDPKPEQQQQQQSLFVNWNYKLPTHPLPPEHVLPSSYAVSTPTSSSTLIAKEEEEDNEKVQYWGSADMMVEKTVTAITEKPKRGRKKKIKTEGDDEEREKKVRNVQGCRRGGRGGGRGRRGGGRGGLSSSSSNQSVMVVAKDGGLVKVENETQKKPPESSGDSAPKAPLPPLPPVMFIPLSSPPTLVSSTDPLLTPKFDVNDIKKPRTIFSDSQCSHMRAIFKQTPYISRQKRELLANKLHITEETVAVWFKNQRSKLKKIYVVP